MSTLPRFAERFEVVVVDDGSSDATARVVREAAQSHPEIRLVSHETNLGYGHAIRTGLQSARGDAVFFTDADRQFRLADIESLLGAFRDADIAAGYRIKRNDPWHRLVVAFVYRHVLRAVFGLHLRDVDCAFKLFRRRALDAVLDELESRSAFISPELMIRARMAGFRIAEVGVPHYPRTAGRPKGATPKVIYRTLREIVRMRRSLGAGRTVRTPPTPAPDGTSNGGTR